MFDFPNAPVAGDVTVALGGSGTDYYAKALVVNYFMYLGA